ncbi:MAG TPA: CapA family protein, partial [Myxococcota bacterium]|nr:CapA family protein [Myxococcota bacterium]
MVWTLLLACAPGPYSVVLDVVGENGKPLPQAVAKLGEQEWQANDDGRIRISPLLRPVMLTVAAPGKLPEPVPVGPDDGQDVVPLTLLDDANGTRRVLHSAGDVMLGRRYVTPTEGEALLKPGDGGTSARAVVSDLWTAFSMADLRLVNLETVVGDFADEEAYPGKRFLLLTPPDGLAALQQLSVDVAGGANNHGRDWLEPGILSTLEELERRNIGHVGLGIDEEEAAAPVIQDLDGMRVALLAWTSVDGDYVNDQYPLDDSPAPAEIDPAEAWIWESRSWGDPDLGVPVASRRIGSAWATYKAATWELNEEEEAQLWVSATAVYPELQDWVARRGHGGGNRWDEDTAVPAIVAAQAEADLVVVQLHMGFQFAPARGDAVEEAAHAAIDAGADLVVCHHPHVLQGLEWYRGKLIAWSTGNFLFDQDFLSTFQSAFLRTVWEEDGSLVQARLVPTFLDAYRPVPSVGWLSRSTLQKLWDRSVLDATAQRGVDLGVRTVLRPRAANAQPPGFVFEHNTARLTEGLADVPATRVEVPEEGLRVLDAPIVSLVPTEGVELGRSLFGLGNFDDVDADSKDMDTPGWTWDSTDIRLSTSGSLLLTRQGGNTDRVSARSIARVPLLPHRLYQDAEGVQPLDGDARFAVRLRYRETGEQERGSVRLALYYFDDLNPTEDPESTLLREVELPLPKAAAWQEVELPLPAGSRRLEVEG